MGSIRFCVLRGYIEKRGVEKEGCVGVKAIQPQTLFPIFLLQCTLGENPGNKCEVPIGNCKFTPLGYSHITCGQRRREGSFPPSLFPSSSLSAAGVGRDDDDDGLPCHFLSPPVGHHTTLAVSPFLARDLPNLRGSFISLKGTESSSLCSNLFLF